MCMIERLAKVDYEPDKDCEDCPVDKECTALIMDITARCTNIAHQLHNVAEQIRKRAREH